MIQRKQSIFLLLAVVMYIITLVTFVSESWLLCGILAVPAVLSIYTIFDYKQRKRQAMFCLVVILATLLWYVCLAAVGDVSPESLSLSAAFPMVSLILVLMARKAILDDEKLVRAADRIR